MRDSISKVPEGAIRYNTDSNKMEVWIGQKWMQVAVSSPDFGNSTAGARGLVMGGNSPGAPNDGRLNNIEYVTITSTGNSQDFGDLTGNGRSDLGSCASATRAFAMGGFDENTPNYNNEIDFVTISSTGNATDFGDLVVKRQPPACFSNATRGCCAGGYIIASLTPLYSSNQGVNIIELITMTSAGNATDFGDMTVAYRNRDSCQSPTRGILAGGYNSPGDDTNVIEFVVTATTGNGVDFGDTVSGKVGWGQNGYGNATRGVFPLASGGGPNYVHDNLSYITLSTLGNTTEYGDLTTNRNLACSFSNPTRGILVAGGSPQSDDIDYNNIATGGVSVDFGEYSAYSHLNASAGCSNAHGGL